MKFRNKQLCFRLIMLLAVMLCTKAMSAENKITIEPFSINSYDVVNIPVLLDNSDAVAALQFDMALPAELEFAGEPVKNVSRLLNGHQLAFNESNGRVMIVARNRQAILGNSGEVLTIPVKVKPGQLSNDAVSVEVSRIEMTTADGSQSWKQDNFDVTVSMQASEYKVYVPEAEFVLNPGSTHQVAVSISNNAPLMAFQMDVVLPQGLTMENDIVLSNRCSNGAYMDVFPQKDKVTTRLMLTDLSGANAVKTGTDGTVFTFTVKASDDFAAENATINIQDFQVSYAPGKSVTGTGCTLTVVNGKPTYEKALASITSLEAELQTALTKIAETAPDVKDQFTGAEITEQINTLKQNVEAAYATNTLATNYDEIMAPATEITNAINALIESAQAAQATADDSKRKEANKAAYDAVVAQIKSLKANAEAAAKEAAEKYPAIDVTAQVSAANEAIANALTDAEAAYKAVETEGFFNYTVDAEAINALIDAIGKAAADGAAAAEAKRQADNKAAYDVVVAQINSLKGAAEAAANEAAEKYPAIDVTAQVNAANEAITNAFTAAEAAYKAVEAEGYFNYTVDAEAINALIEAIGKTAVEGFEDAEAKRKANNKAAYDAVIAQLDALQSKLETTMKIVSDLFKHANVDAEQNAAQEAIYKAMTAAKNAFDAVAESGDFNYTADTKAIETLIDAIVPAAQKSEADYEEEQRKAANEDAYNAVMSQIDALQAELYATLTNVNIEYPGANVSAATKTAQDAINKVRAEAENAYKAVADNGSYSYALDETEIKNLIAAIVEAAKSSGINEIYADELGEDIKIYTIDGIQLAAPQPDKINIIVGTDGKARKIYVK